MKRKSLWKLSVVTTPAAEDAIAESLSRMFGVTSSIHWDASTGRTSVSVYLQGNSPKVAEWRSVVKQALSELEKVGVSPGSMAVRILKLRRENWAESWKRHFKPIEIADKLLIKPSWSRRRPKRGQAEVVLDPGLSFGTGQHATTWFCLQQLAQHRTSGVTQSLLDMGTGSGILAISAAKLGYNPVEAFDFDSECIRIALANARCNRVAGRVKFSVKDLMHLPQRARNGFDVVCANLISTLLLAERRRIVARLNPGGLLVLAGILTTEFAQVRHAFEGAGLVHVTSRRQAEWTSGSFVLPR